jgi:hypothetical protein
LIDSTFYFEVNPYHLANFNSWELNISLNNIKIYSFGAYDLKQNGEGIWQNYSIPLDLWLNTTNVFTSNILNDTTITIKIELVYSSTSASYGPEDGEKIEYQLFYIDNVQLITKAEAYPSDIDLIINQTIPVENIDWGKGTVEIKNGNWKADKVYANFSSNQVENLSIFEYHGEFISYRIDFQTDLNLFAIQNEPETFHEPIPGYIGTKFSLTNESLVNWDCFAYVNVSTGYAESEMRLNFPKDFNITSVYDAGEPTNNISDDPRVDHSIKGELRIVSDKITGLSNGYWMFKATSPNYCEQITIYNDVTGSWQKNSTFLSGDNINITAKITTLNAFVDISGYISNTKAQLFIRFPDGNLWTAQNQIKSPDANGHVYFDDFPIPAIAGPDYQAGEYEAIVTWNNSHSIYEMNETGIIYTNFTVVHDSILKTIDNNYNFVEIMEDEVINVKFLFKDKIDNKAIENALVYAKNFTGQTQILSEPGNGSYWLEFNASKATLGNNTITIYANSSYYLNKNVNITIEVVKETTFSVVNDFLTNIPYNQNFTVEFNYTELKSGIGIDTNPITDWTLGDYLFIQTSPGNYNLTCNTTSYNAGELIYFYIFLKEDTYQAQTIEIRVQIIELNTYIEVFVNGTQLFENGKYPSPVEVDDQINITVRYKEYLGNKHLNDATVELKGRGKLTEQPTFKQYNMTLSAEDLDHGITSLEINANKTNYKFNSFLFFIEVTERNTNLQIFFNNINKTTTRFTEIIIGTSLNITIKYSDIYGVHIKGATVILSGAIEANMTEDSDSEQYFIILDTNILDIGVQIVELNINKPNYQSHNPKLRINIRKIRTEIEIEDGEDSITISPGDSVKIEIILRNLDFGGKIKGAKVKLEWKHGDEDLDEEDDGIYTTKLKDIPEGTYTLTISASTSENIYDFDNYEITLNVVRKEEEALLFQVLLIIAIIVAVAISSYLIAYQRVLKYPKPVRKVRKYRRTLKRKKQPRVDITSRKKTFKDLYSEKLDKTGNFLNGKTSEQIAATDKMVKKTLKISSNELIKASAQKQSEKKGDKK